jgi:hypothetical protein
MMMDFQSSDSPLRTGTPLSSLDFVSPNDEQTPLAVSPAALWNCADCSNRVSVAPSLVSDNTTLLRSRSAIVVDVGSTLAGGVHEDLPLLPFLLDDHAPLLFSSSTVRPTLLQRRPTQDSASTVTESSRFGRDDINYDNSNSNSNRSSHEGEEEGEDFDQEIAALTLPPVGTTCTLRAGTILNARDSNSLKNPTTPEPPPIVRFGGVFPKSSTTTCTNPVAALPIILQQETRNNKRRYARSLSDSQLLFVPCGCCRSSSNQASTSTQSSLLPVPSASALRMDGAIGTFSTTVEDTNFKKSNFKKSDEKSSHHPGRTTPVLLFPKPAFLRSKSSDSHTTARSSRRSLALACRRTYRSNRPSPDKKLATL